MEIKRGKCVLASRVVRGTLDRYNIITGNVYINGQR